MRLGGSEHLETFHINCDIDNLKANVQAEMRERKRKETEQEKERERIVRSQRIEIRDKRMEKERNRSREDVGQSNRFTMGECQLLKNLHDIGVN